MSNLIADFSSLGLLVTGLPLVVAAIWLLFAWDKKE